MQENQENNSPANPYRWVCHVLSWCAHILLLGILGLSCLTRKTPPPPPLVEVELLEAFGGAPNSLPQTPQPPKPEPPKPEPPKPEPPKPEPPKPEPPKPEPPKPEPPKPEPPKSPKPSKPKKPEGKKQPSLEERLREAKVTTPKKPQSQAPQKKDTLDRQVQERLRQSESTLSRPSVSSPARQSGNPNPGLRGAQLNAYQTYIVSCLQPAMQPLWDQLGPDGLRGAPRPVQITLTISPNGRVLSGFISDSSDSAVMNSAAKDLLGRMQGMSLPPFSQVGLPTTQGSLQFVVNLECRLQNSR